MYVKSDLSAAKVAVNSILTVICVEKTILHVVRMPQPKRIRKAAPQSIPRKMTFMTYLIVAHIQPTQ